MRKGVTLMELLISVMTITLLSAAFMLSVSEMSATANANRIFSNMKAIKLAAIKWSKDNPEKIVDGGMYINTGSGKEFIQAANKNDALGIGKYLGGGEKIIINEGTQNTGLKKYTYGIYNVGPGRTATRKTWYVGYRFGDDEYEARDKLKGKKDKLGIHFSKLWPCEELDGDATVWLKIRGDANP